MVFDHIFLGGGQKKEIHILFSHASKSYSFGWSLVLYRNVQSFTKFLLPCTRLSRVFHMFFTCLLRAAYVVLYVSACIGFALPLTSV